MKTGKYKIPPWADLTGADLTWAHLIGADLTGADLTGADLTGADLTWANLTEADLARANLTEANLTEADLTRTDLRHTCLDPSAPVPSSNLAALQAYPDDTDFVTGWRSERSIYSGDTHYRSGEEYSAPWFSTCTQTECHPGIYFCATESEARQYSDDIIQCIALRSEILHVGKKYRAKRIYVL